MAQFSRDFGSFGLYDPILDNTQRFCRSGPQVKVGQAKKHIVTHPIYNCNDDSFAAVDYEQA